MPDLNDIEELKKTVHFEELRIAEFESELLNKERRLQLLDDLQEIFQSAHNLLSVFKQFYKVVQKYLGDTESTRVNLLLYDKTRNGLIGEQYFGLSGPGTKGSPQPIGHSISGICFRDAKIILIKDCSQSDIIPKKYVEELNLKTAVAIPVIFREKPIGVLRIDNLKVTDAFPEEQIGVFSLIANQLAIVIENARLIEEQKKYIEEKESVENVYRSTIANAQGIAYTFHSKNDNYDFISDNCEEVLGIPANKLTRSIVRNMVEEIIVADPNGPADIREYIRLINSGVKENYKVHLRITTQDGKEKWLSDFSLANRDPETGEIIGHQGIMQDITQQKKNEKINLALLKISTAVHSVKTLEELYPLIHNALLSIMDARNFYIALIDREKTNIIFPYVKDELDIPPWNPIPLKNSQSLTVEILHTPQILLLDGKDLDERYRTGKSKVMGVRSQCWLGASLVIKGETIGAIAVQSYYDPHSYKEEDKKILQSLAEHVAISIERKRSEEELNRINHELHKTNAEKDKFFSIIAHDLKSPFYSFLGMTEMLANEIETLSKSELVEFSQMMNDTAKNLYKLLENLLEWSLMKKGAIDFAPKEMDLFEVVFDNVDILTPRAEQKGITLVNAVPEAFGIYADEKMMNSLIRNLLSNAVKFTNRGGKVTISANKCDNKTIEISVTDTGVGIPPKELKKLFRLEEKVGTKGTDNETSTGLGLLLCKEFIEKHSGKIRVTSEVGLGTTFTLSLPAIS